MGEFTKDLMMSMVVGGTAFIGLTPVLIGQVTNSGLKQRCKKVLRWLLVLSVVFGIFAVAWAVNWLLKPTSVFAVQAIWFFTAEIGICEFVMLFFWLGVFGEVERSKPATRTTRPLSSQERGLRSALGGIIAVLAIAISLLFQGLAWRGEWDIKTLGNLALILGSVFAIVGLVLLFVLLCPRIKKR